MKAVNTLLLLVDSLELSQRLRVFSQIESFSLNRLNTQMDLRCIGFGIVILVLSCSASVHGKS